MNRALASIINEKYIKFLVGKLEEMRLLVT
jgi:hypothetical protein